MSGRTFFLKKDGAWWERGAVRRARKEFGPTGPAVMDWLECAAKRQNAAGRVKADPLTIAEDIGSDEVTVCHVVSHLVQKEWLVSYETDRDLFKAMIAWFEADQRRGDDAERKAESRAKQAETESLSRSVTESHLREEKKREEQKKETTLSAAPTDDVQAVFDAWITSTKRTGATVLNPERRKKIQNALKLYSLPDVLDAVDGWRFSPHHRGENDRSTVYNDIELLLASSKNVEKFRDLKRNGGNVVAISDGTKTPGEFDHYNKAAGL